MAVQLHYPIIKVLAPCMGKNASNDIATASSKSASTVGVGLSELHSNELLCIIPKLSF